MNPLTEEQKYALGGAICGIIGWIIVLLIDKEQALSNPMYYIAWAFVSALFTGCCAVILLRIFPRQEIRMHDKEQQ